MNAAPSAPALSAGELVPEAAAFVYNAFKEKLPEFLVFHTYQHAVDVAASVGRIGGKAGLREETLALVTLAAWFHDLGYLESYEQPAEAGARIASRYLEHRGLPEEEIDQVVSLIRFVHSGARPHAPAEAVLYDANLAHAGSKSFLDRSSRLRAEWTQALQCSFTDQEWAERELEFLTGVHFVTDYARKKYEPRRAKNLDRVHARLAVHLGSMPGGDGQSVRPTSRPRSSERGVETMFRTAYRNHMGLSAIADSKANLMISVTAILLSVLISFVSSRMHTNPWIIIPSATMLLTCVTAGTFAILSARPKVTSNPLTLDDLRRNPRANILFFGNFTRLPLEDFRTGIHDLMDDADFMYDNMIGDLYSLGHVLRKKYRLLWLSYSIFMGGLILTVVLLFVFFYFS